MRAGTSRTTLSTPPTTRTTWTVTRGSWCGWTTPAGSSPGASSMPSLLALADPSDITYGRDFPYAPAVEVPMFTADLDAYQDADHDAAVNRGNAEQLFTSFARGRVTDGRHARRPDRRHKRHGPGRLRHERRSRLPRSHHFDSRTTNVALPSPGSGISRRVSERGKQPARRRYEHGETAGAENTASAPACRRFSGALMGLSRKGRTVIAGRVQAPARTTCPVPRGPDKERRRTR